MWRAIHLFASGVSGAMLLGLGIDLVMDGNIELAARAHEKTLTAASVLLVMVNVLAVFLSTLRAGWLENGGS